MSESSEEKLNRVRLMASGDPTWDLSPNDVEALRYLLTELGRLKEIVDRLPKFRDGATAYPGATGVARHGSGWKKVEVQNDCRFASDVDGFPTLVSSCYSTREAAEKARHG